MTKRTTIHLALTIGLLALALFIGNWGKGKNLLNRYAAEVSSHIQDSEKKAVAWIGQQSAFLQATANSNASPGNVRLAEEAFESIRNQDFTILLHRNSEILFWTNNRAVPTQQEFAALAKLPEKAFFQLPVGSFFAKRQALGNATLTTLIPIKYSLTADPTRQQHLFPADEDIPDEIEVLKQQTAGSVAVNVDAQAFCWLDASPNVRHSWIQWYIFGLALLFLISFFTLVDKASIQVAERFRPFVGTAFVIFTVGLLILLISVFHITDYFDALSIFARKFDSPLLGGSLGEWLLYIVVALWLMVFFHREFRVDSWGNLPAATRITLGVGYNFAIMMSIVFTVMLFRQLIFASRINFDFDNILNLDRYALLAISGIILLLAGLFLFSHRMMRTIYQIAQNKLHRSVSLVVAGLLLYPFCISTYELIELPPAYVVAFNFVYVVAFDFFIAKKQPGFGWIVTWLLLFSLFSALLLYRYNDENDYGMRKDCAFALSDDRDEQVAEPKLESLFESLKKDTLLSRALGPTHVPGEKPDVKAYFSKRVFQDSYLSYHYKTNVFAFAPDDSPAINGMECNSDSIVKNVWDKAKPVGNSGGIRWNTDSLGNFFYILKIPTLRYNDPAHPANVFATFHHQYPSDSKIYAQVFNNLPYKNLSLLPRYDFAIFKDKRLATKLGNVNSQLFNPVNFPEPGVFRDVKLGWKTRLDFIYTSDDGRTTVVVGRHIGSIIKPMYLFSTLFTLLSIFMILLGFFNSRFRFLPDYYQFYITTKGSLAKRIQYYTVGLIVGSFMLIGWFTYQHFTNSSDDAELQRLDYRISSMLNHLAPETVGLTPNDSLLRQKLPPLLLPLAKSFSTDAHLYSRSGELLTTTQENLLQVGLLSRKMGAGAFHSLRNQNSWVEMEQEQAGSIKFLTRYASIRNSRNELLGFIGVPYLLENRSNSAELSDFIGILMTLYVFLLIIAGSVTFLVARSIIKPIQLIAQKITLLRLENQNQPLEYVGDGQDELSTLIEEYNRMVEKLEGSKHLLIKLEREGAWKEMARQVAHDIKNPLTAMKLSMQQLERVSGGDPVEAKNYLKKAISRLIGQIDSLAAIASDFSTFAKLDSVEKHNVSLNDVVENVFDLFAETEGIDFQKNIPEEKIHVAGDHNHLMRVFNNLIINATQAIPSDRRGLIRVAVYQQGDVAQIRVSDNAGGIPPEVAKRIFEPNFTTKTSGSGLGLAICKKIIQLHDGNIWFETREGDGSDFYVELPLWKGEVEV